MKKCVAMLLAVLLVAGMAQATVILNHQGQNNPTTEGFYYATSNPSNTSGYTPTVGPVSDGGTDAWQVNTMVQQALYGYYENDSTMAAQAYNLYTNGWTLTVKARVAETYQAGSGNAGAYLSMTVGGLRYVLGLNLDSTGTPTNTQVWSSSGTVHNTTLGYHTYELTALPQSVNPSYYATLKIDGVLVESNIKAISSGSSIYFGDASGNSGQNTNTNWAQVMLQTPPVPEPATLSLLVMAAVGTLLRKRS